jgi:uncharacterized protein YraI
MSAIGRVTIALALSCFSCTANGGEDELVSADDSVAFQAQIAGSPTAGAMLRTTDPLNLRTGASTSYSVILVMPAGATVKLVAAAPTNGFYQVTYETKTGWASGAYLAQQASKKLQATEYVHLRNGPGTTYAILETIPQGGTVTLLAEATKNGFYNVNYNGTAGWSSSAYFTTESSSGCSVSTTPLYCKVPYINQMSSSGSADDWNRFSNCGPTTMAMIARAFGYRSDLSDGSLVNHLGNSAGVGADGAGYDKIATMARTMGKQPTVKTGANASWVKSQLAGGRLVAINGNRVVTLKYDGDSTTSGSGTQGHWIVGAGLTAAGDILVKDPSVPGVRSLTPAQLDEFITTNYNGNNAVAVGN